MKYFKRFLVLSAILLLLFQVPFSCAQRGRPEGGPVDSLPPVFVNATPPNYSTHFKGKKIRINFDEYVKLQKPNEQIIISPPVSPRPIIEPQGLPSKYIDIEFMDTLQSNTTYTINFGLSVADNNEGNILPFFKYVFSTGSELDSLKIMGRVEDAFDPETPQGIYVQLYKLDSTYTDSTIYKHRPTYVGATRDSLNHFIIENLSEGDYKIMALRDKSQDYLFDQKSDKIGFLPDTIHIPTEQEFKLKIFKEERDFKPRRPEQVSKRHLLFGFHGRADSVEVTPLSGVSPDYEARYYWRTDTDSIDYWYKPIQKDTLQFLVHNGSVLDTVRAFLKKDAEKDSLELKGIPSSGLPLSQRFAISANTPLEAVEKDLISVLDKDSLPVKFSPQLNRRYNQVKLNFTPEPSEVYQVRLLPGAIEDFYGEQNDTLNYTFRTKSAIEYADLLLNLQNLKHYPVIVQLTDLKGETKRELVHHREDGAVFHFSFVDPGTYLVRVIYDENDNGRWDTGRFLEGKQPEKVIYMPKPLKLRRNWEVSQDFLLK